MDETIKGICVVCNGQLVEKIVQRFNARYGPMIIGPRSKEQIEKVKDGYFCTNCGLKYEFLPKQNRKKPLLRKEPQRRNEKIPLTTKTRL